jgi:hypothetical protein
MTERTVAVIGADLADLSVAHLLRKAGLDFACWRPETEQVVAFSRQMNRAGGVRSASIWARHGFGHKSIHS